MMVDRAGGIQAFDEFFGKHGLGSSRKRSRNDGVFRAVGRSEPFRVLISGVPHRIVVHHKHNHARYIPVTPDQMFRLTPITFGLRRIGQIRFKILYVGKCQCGQHPLF